MSVAGPVKERRRASVGKKQVTDSPAPASANASPDVIPLSRSLGYHLRELAESWTTAMDAAAQPYGISLSQWRYLRELWENDGLSSGELTRRVGRQGPTTVVAVQSLERAGLIRTERSEHDRRKGSVHLTARGRKLATTLAPVIRQVNENACEGLTADEIRIFKKVLVRTQRNLDATTRHRSSWLVWRTEILAKEVGE
jgi:MarR family transcriptional regulator, organic hydroperoxide resistance regulator